MIYPPHLWDAEERIGRLWACDDLDAVFPEAVPKATLPWPRARRIGRGQLHDKVQLAAEMAEALPCIALLDPRTLWASQPYATRAGVEYYLGPTWFRTGLTYADQEQRFNRLPVVERRSDGTDVLLGGHHRSCASLLLGRPVLARCIVHAGRDAPVERVDLRLPSLALGPWSAAVAVDSVAEALAAIEAGTPVSVPTADLARSIEQSLLA